MQLKLEPWIYISRAAAFRSVAGNIFKLALFLAAWTGIRSDRGRNQKTAVAAFPVRQSTARTNITRKISGQVHPAAFTCLRIAHSIILRIRVNWNKSSPVLYHRKNNLHCIPDSLNSTGSRGQQNNLKITNEKQGGIV